MPRNKRKLAKPAENKPENPTPPPPPQTDVKAQFQKLQLAVLARSLRSVDFEFAIKTKEDLVAYQTQLLHMHLKRELAGADLSAQSHGVRNLIQLIAPPQAPVQTVTVNVSPEAALKAADSLTEDEQVILARAINHLESQGSALG